MGRPRRFELVPGMRSGRWTLIALHRSGRTIQWHCRCECGNEGFVCQGNIFSGKSNSCGCLQRERTSEAHRTHGESRRSPEYRTWANMISRCHNPNQEAYKDYGAKGITVCEEWRNSYEAFLEHVGRKPSPDHSIDRIDFRKGYFPGNVRWATTYVQSRNRSNNKLIAFDGKSMTIGDWAALLGFSFDALRNRLRRDWSIERTLTTPLVGNPDRSTKA